MKNPQKRQNFKCNKKLIYRCLMPGWLSWLERTAHRVIKQCSDLFLGYREAAGSNPAPGILNPRN